MKNPNHPGEIIRDCLDESGVNVTEGAKALGSTAAFWLRLQLNYALAQVQARSGKIHARRLGNPAQLAL
jgi:plasmid maintenance system antidote protein VapI